MLNFAKYCKEFEGRTMTLIFSGQMGISGNIGLTKTRFTVPAVTFDGTNDYLLRGSDYTGSADGSLGIFSGWIKFNGGDGANQNFVHHTAGAGTVRRLSTNLLEFDVFTQTNSGINRLTVRSSNTYTVSGTWLHVLCSWSTNFSAGNKISHLYVNDVSDKVVFEDVGTVANINYTVAEHSVGGRVDGGGKLNGDMAQIYYAPGQFLDFSVEANRRLFISSSGGPVDLGSDGSTPTASAPILFLNGAASTFATNLGTGGGMTTNGALTNASSSP